MPGIDSGVEDKDLGYEELLEKLTALDDTEMGVFVGVMGKAGSEMIIIAASNEFGTDDGHVPERSYLRSTVDKGQEEIAEDLEVALLGVVDEGDDLKKNLGLVGLKWAANVQLTITNFTTPPNAPSTIKAKKGNDSPLRNHGRLRSSITWEVRDGDDG